MGSSGRCLWFSFALGLVTAAGNAQSGAPLFSNLMYPTNGAVTGVPAAEFDRDGSGNGFGPVPIPNNPILVGLTYYLQVYWVFGPAASCDASSLGFRSSPGMALTLQP